MKQILRDYIAASGLFLEGTERMDINEPLNVYAGINVTKTDKEPIDQLQVFIAAKRIQEWNMEQFGETGVFIPFIAGQYEVLNATSLEEATTIVTQNKKKELQKKKLFTKIIKQFNLNARIITTEDVWSDKRYWNILLSLLGTGDFLRGALIQDTLNFYETKEQLFQTVKVKELPSSVVKLPLPFIKQIGNWPAPLLYTPCEVAEAFYFQQTQNVQCKIGQAQERVYDKYLIDQFTVFRLRQPVDLLSTTQKPFTVTPYIDKAKAKASSRIYFTDSAKAVRQKVSSVKPGQTVFATDMEFGEVLNPLVEKVILALESARAQQKTPLQIGPIVASSGQELIRSLLRGELTVLDIQTILPSLIGMFIFTSGRNI